MSVISCGDKDTVDQDQAIGAPRHFDQLLEFSVPIAASMAFDDKNGRAGPSIGKGIGEGAYGDARGRFHIGSSSSGPLSAAPSSCGQSATSAHTRRTSASVRP